MVSQVLTRAVLPSPFSRMLAHLSARELDFLQVESGKGWTPVELTKKEAGRQPREAWGRWTEPYGGSPSLGGGRTFRRGLQEARGRKPELSKAATKKIKSPHSRTQG